jgi:hypothetical protein
MVDIQRYFGAGSPYHQAAVTPPSIRKSLPVMKAPSIENVRFGSDAVVQIPVG